MDEAQKLLVSVKSALSLSVLLVAATVLHAQEQAAETDSSDEYALRYAQTYLQLTRAKLEYDLARNARVRGSVSKARIMEREEDVRVAKSLLAAAQKGGDEREFSVFVRLAAASYTAAYNNWERAKAANDREPSDSGAANVKRLRLQLELALINYERGKALMDADVAAQTRWKINLLYDEVLRLNERVERIGRGRLGVQ